MIKRHRRRYLTDYEQCPWIKKHVEAIYRNLRGMIVADGQWHDFPPLPRHIGKYRVYGGRYFQAIYARTPNHVLGSLMNMPPVETEDDAEWSIWQLDWGQGYALTSRFALTPGPFDHHAGVADWLYRHGLGLIPENGSVRGVAYFTNIEPGCLRDAMDRLIWLENAILHINRELQELSRKHWDELKQASDKIMAERDPSTDPDEIMSLPEQYRRSGWKHREPR